MIERLNERNSNIFGVILFEFSFHFCLVFFFSFFLKWQMNDNHFHFGSRIIFYSFIGSSNNDRMSSKKFTKTIGTLRYILVNFCYYGRTIICWQILSCEYALKYLWICFQCPFKMELFAPTWAVRHSTVQEKQRNEE